MKTTPQWLLRRFSSRILELLERHVNRAPALDIHAEAIQQSASEFMEAYDDAQALSQSFSEAIGDRTEASDELARNMRAWTAAMVKDIESFDRGKYGDNPGVAQDVVDDARAILVFLDKHEESGGALPSYTDRLREDLTARIEAVEADLKAAMSRNAKVSEMRKQTRDKAVVFHKDLVAFRRALRALVGSNHPDYQAIRVSRVAGEQDDEEEVVEDTDDSVVEDSGIEPNPETEDVAEAS